MANRIRKGDPRGFNKGRSSKFHEGSRVRQTPEEGRRTYRPKRCGNNYKDEDNSLKNLNDKNFTSVFLILRCFFFFFCYVTNIFFCSCFVTVILRVQFSLSALLTYDSGFICPSDFENLSRQLLRPECFFLFSPCLNSQFVFKLVEWDDRIFVC